MAFMLPATPAHARNLAGVAADLLAATGSGGALGRARSVVLVVIDGLGAVQLRAHAGHARMLAGMMAKRDVARTVFPSTTAAALSSLLTGAQPGQHGMVGYAIRDPESAVIVNQLTGWGQGSVQPSTWQRAQTMFETALAAGQPAYAVGPAEFQGSGFTNAVLRGATYVGENEPRARVARALQLAAASTGAVVYCYLPEVDKAGHRHGVASDAWRAALEDVDAAFRIDIPDDIGVVITADHGMVDVPPTRHVLLGDDDPRWEGVGQLGGEPRMLHVYVDAGADARAVAERWRTEAGSSADVLLRDEAVELGLFGAVAAEVLPRIGDVLVVTRGVWAYYDNRTGADTRPQRMIGQHGSVTPEEVIVPFIRAGAFRPV